MMASLTTIIYHGALVAAGMVAIMIAAWLWQKRTGNAGWIDVFWTFGTGAGCVAVALSSLYSPAQDGSVLRQLMVAALAALWSLRLGIYMARRVAHSPEDLRYRALRQQWGDHFQSRLLRFVMLQPPVSALLALSVFVAAHSAGPLSLRDFAGLAILAIAIAGEAIADEQMRRYKNDPNRSPIMDSGLWALSRHPNYFFEWLGWMAYPFIAFTPAIGVSWLSLLAPAVMYLVLRYGTGLPLLEASMLQRKGTAFRNYQRRVNAFFPSLWRASS